MDGFASSWDDDDVFVCVFFNRKNDIPAVVEAR